MKEWELGLGHWEEKWKESLLGRGKEVGKGLEISKGWRRESDYGYKGNLMVEWKSGIDPDYVANVVRFLS